MSSSRNPRGEDRKTRDAGQSSKGKARAGPGKRARGTYRVFGEVKGTGTVDDPQITWLIGRPEDFGDFYESMVRDAATATGYGAWYIRSLAHSTTSIGGTVVRDDPHITVFADLYPGGSLQEDFEMEGHIYVAMDDEEVRCPRRLLHPEEFEWPDTTLDDAPVVLYSSATQDPHAYFLDDDYYDWYDRLQYFEEEAAIGSQAEASGAAPEEKAKKKRKRKHKGKGKGKGKMPAT